MTTTVQSILWEAQDQLSDLAGVRWPATELARYLNDGQREAAVFRPEMFAVTAALTLSAGIKQALPAGAIKLIDILRNTGGVSITKTSRSLLDSVVPGWYSMTGATVIQHFCHEPRDPLVFVVYPPAAASGASVDVTYAALPADVATPSGAAYTTASGNITAPDTFKNALLSFVLYRAFAKDSEFGGNAALSAAHYGLFKSGLSDDAATTQSIRPMAPSGTTQ